MILILLNNLFKRIKNSLYHLFFNPLRVSLYSGLLSHNPLIYHKISRYYTMLSSRLLNSLKMGNSSLAEHYDFIDV